MARKATTTQRPDDESIRKALLTGTDGKPRKATGGGASPGMFGLRATGNANFARAIDLGYVEACDPPPEVRRTRTTPPYAFVTGKGCEWALGQVPAGETLERLLALLQGQDESLRPGGTEASAIQAQLDALSGQFEQARRAIADAAARTPANSGAACSSVCWRCCKP